MAGLDMLVERALCGFEIRERIASPSGVRVAVVFEHDCGATTPFNTQLSVMPEGKTFSPEAYPSFFSVHGRHFLHPRWEGDEALTIKVPAGEAVYRKEQPASLRVIYAE